MRPFFLLFLSSSSAAYVYLRHIYSCLRNFNMIMKGFSCHISVTKSEICIRFIFLPIRTRKVGINQKKRSLVPFFCVANGRNSTAYKIEIRENKFNSTVSPLCIYESREINLTLHEHE